MRQSIHPLGDTTYHFVKANVLNSLQDKEIASLKDRIQRLEEALEGSWSIIANVSDGDWTRQKPYWQDYVFRWRDNYFNPIMKELSECKAKDSQ
jgi:hypothetical protein